MKGISNKSSETATELEIRTKDSGARRYFVKRASTSLRTLGLKSSDMRQHKLMYANRVQEYYYKREKRRKEAVERCEAQNSQTFL